MRILYIGFPAQGHTNGTIGFLNSLSKENEVTCITNSKYSENYRSYKLNYKILDFLNNPIDIKEFTKDYFIGFRYLIDNLDSIISQLESAINPHEFDLVIHDSLALYGYIFAKKHNIPACSAITNYAFFKGNIQYKYIIKDFLKSQLKRTPLALTTQLKYLYLARKYKMKNHSLINLLLLEQDLNFIFFPKEVYNKDFNHKAIYLNSNLRVNKVQPKTNKDNIFISLGTVLPNDKLLRDLFHLFNGTKYSIIMLTQSQSLTNEFSEYKSKNIQVLTSGDQISILKKCKVAIYQAGANTASECMALGIYHFLFPQQVEQQHMSSMLENLEIARRVKEDKIHKLLKYLEEISKDKTIDKKLDYINNLVHEDFNFYECQSRLDNYVLDYKQKNSIK